MKIPTPQDIGVRISTRKKNFAINYVLNLETKGNATKSAIKAGYRQRFSEGNAYKFVEQRGIKEYIQYLTENERKRLSATKDQAILEARTNYENSNTHSERKYWYDMWVNLQSWLVQKSEVKTDNKTEITAEISKAIVEEVNRIRSLEHQTIN